MRIPLRACPSSGRTGSGSATGGATGSRFLGRSTTSFGRLQHPAACIRWRPANTRQDRCY